MTDDKPTIPDEVRAKLQDCFSEEDAEYVFECLDAVFSGYEIRPAAPTVGEGFVAVPVEPTSEIIQAGLDELGWHVDPYEAPKESGVETESSISQEDADEINGQMAAQVRDLYHAMLRAHIAQTGGG